MNPNNPAHAIVEKYQTFDGGLTWEVLPPFSGIEIDKVYSAKFFEDNPNKILISANVAGNSRTYITEDNFASTYYVNNVGLLQIISKPFSVDTLYGRSLTKVYRSTNGGFAWQVISNNGYESILAVSSNSPNSLYLAKHGTNPAQIFKSFDKGTNWTLINNTDIQTIRSWHNNAFGVSDIDSNRLFFGTVDAYLSVDGGQNFYRQSRHDYCGTLEHIQSRRLHPDQQDAIPIPGTDSIIVVNDGGVYIHDFSTDTIAQYINTGTCFTLGPNAVGSYYNKTDRLNIGEVWGFDFSSQNANQGLTALWHNGTSLAIDDTLFGKAGGDGFSCWINPDDNNEFYTTSQYGGIVRRTITPSSLNILSSNSGDFRTKVLLDKKEPNILYHTNYDWGVRRSINKGDNWTNISNRKATSFSIHPIQNNYIYMNTSLDPDLLQYSLDKGDNWQSNSLPFSFDFIKPHATNPNSLFLVHNGNNSKVYSVENLSSNYTDITHNLPNINIQAFEIDDNNGLYVATTSAVFYLRFESTEWIELGAGTLPFIPINILRVDNERKKLFIGTDGRGVWSIKTPDYKQVVNDTISLCAGESIEINGINYSIPGFYSDTIQGSNQCDSIYHQINIIDGSGTPNCSSLDVMSLEETSFNLYPNPATYFLNVEFDLKSNYTIQIINSVGKIVTVANTNEHTTQLPVYSLSNGVYFLVIKNMEGAILQKKLFIKE